MGKELKFRTFAFGALFLVVLLIGVMPRVFESAQAYYSGITVVYIREDGSIDPPVPEIRTSDVYGDDYYCLTQDIVFREDPPHGHCIVVQKDNIVLDGCGRFITGIGMIEGWPVITVSGRKNVTIRNIEISLNGLRFYSGEGGDPWLGIYVRNSEGIQIKGNLLYYTYFDSIIIRDSFNVQISRNNVSIRETDAYPRCIKLINSSKCVISQNNLSGDNHDVVPDAAIHLDRSDNNSIYENSIRFSVGFALFSSSGNGIFRNTVTSHYSAYLESSHQNRFYQNIFLSAPALFLGGPVQSGDTSHNTWDNGYPSGGNYWSNFNGTDFCTGVNQNLTGKDGLGDSPYFIYANNVDNYPLVGSFNEFGVDTSFGHQRILTLSNSEVRDVDFSILNQSEAKFCFKVNQAVDSNGFCRVNIPKVLINEPYTVKIDGEIVNDPFVRELPFPASTFEYLYVEVPQGEHAIEIAGTTKVALIEKEKSDEPTPTPEPNPTPSPSPSPTSTPTPMPSPAPSPSPSPSPAPSPTPTLAPSPSPSPLPSPTPVSSPLSFPVPVSYIGVAVIAIIAIAFIALALLMRRRKKEITI